MSDQLNAKSSADLRTVLTGVAPKLDALRAASLTTVETLRTARQTRLVSERQRLSRALGETHPRVASMDAKLAAGAADLVGVALEKARAAVASPAAHASAWVFHGLVLTTSRRPVAGVAVAVLARKGVPFPGASSTTDAHGAFRLTVDVASPPQVVIRSAASAVAGAQDAAVAPLPKTAVVVEATDASGAVVYSGQAAIAAGLVEYREIVIPDRPAAGAPSIGKSPGPTPVPPGGVTRTVAKKRRPAPRKKSK